MQTEATVQFKMVAGRMTPTRVTVERYGMYPDTDGKMPKPDDGGLLEEICDMVKGDNPGKDY